MNTIRINDHGRLLMLDYEHFAAYHGGGAVAGAAIGFRAMERAGIALSCRELWDREHISVTTRHRGPGVRDAIEYVTRCVTRGHFRVDEEDDSTPSCASESAFHFVVSNGREQAVITLREGIVAQRFLDAVRHFQASGRVGQEGTDFEELKSEVAMNVMEKSLDELFTLQLGESQTAGREHA